MQKTSQDLLKKITVPFNLLKIDTTSFLYPKYKIILAFLQLITISFLYHVLLFFAPLFFNTYVPFLYAKKISIEPIEPQF